MVERTGHRKIRQVSLLAGEELVEAFTPAEGRVAIPPDEGTLVALTSKRVIVFSQEEGKEQMTLAWVDQLEGATLRSQQRNARNLYYGIGLLFLALIVYLFVGTFLAGIVVAGLAGGVIAVLGVMFLLQYFFWVGAGSLIFHGSGWEVSVSYSGDNTRSDALEFVQSFFQVKQGGLASHPTPEQRELPEVSPLDDVSLRGGSTGDHPDQEPSSTPSSQG